SDLDEKFPSTAVFRSRIKICLWIQSRRSTPVVSTRGRFGSQTRDGVVGRRVDARAELQLAGRSRARKSWLRCGPARARLAGKRVRSRARLYQCPLSPLFERSESRSAQARSRLQERHVEAHPTVS